MKIIFSTKSGINKSECEDAVLVNTCVYNDECNVVEMDKFKQIAISDGVGGNRGGKDASLYLLNAIGQLQIESSDALRINLETINKDLIAYGKKLGDKDRMATTFTGVFLCNDHMYVAHVGNTRLYAKRGSYLKQITQDHTTYQMLLDRGIEEAAEICNKSEIQACFGGGKEKYLERLVVDKIFTEKTPQRIIFTSDGIHDYVNIDDMEAWLIKTPNIETGIQSLDELAIQNGSKDDRTIIVVDFD